MRAARLAFVVLLVLPGIVALPSWIAAASDGSTELSISAPATVDADQEFSVSATFREHGVPLAGRELVFVRHASFGALEIARAITDALGNAAVSVSIPSQGTSLVSVEFAGDALLRPNVATATIVVVGVEPPPPDFLAILSVGVVVAAVVGSVWACYAFVFTQLLGIRREGRLADRRGRI